MTPLRNKAVSSMVLLTSALSSGVEGDVVIERTGRCGVESSSGIVDVVVSS